MTEQFFDTYFHESARILESLSGISESVADLALAMASCLQNGGTIFWCGNGGSASDSQHLAAELVGRFEMNRRPLSSIALTTDTSIITSLANDFSFGEIFSRQLEALGKPGDIIIGITTSGSSENVQNALKIAKKLDIKSVLLTSEKFKGSKSDFDYVISVPSSTTCHIQEGHIAIGQALCKFIEQHFFLK